MSRPGCSTSLLLFLVAIFTQSCRGELPGKPNRPQNDSFSSSPPPPPPSRPALFVFGDSFLDTGNNNYINTTTLDQANFWPYGETYFGFPSGRFSDGRLVSDFIAQYAKLPLIPPFLQPGSRLHYYGVNFASGGAGALDETFGGSVISLNTQLQHYRQVEALLRRKLGKEAAKERISKAVYLFSIGSNDYTSLFLTKSTLLNTFPSGSPQYVGTVLGNFSKVIKEIYETGGRKFAVMNVPQLGCFPSMRILKSNDDGRCFEEVSVLARAHNKALLNLLCEMTQQLKEFKFSLFDLYNSVRLRMNDPSKYGFKEGEEACCGAGRFRGIYSCGGKRTVKEFELCENPSHHLHWDSFHLTEEAYKQLAGEIWSGAGTTNTALVHGHHNLKDFFQVL